MCSKNYLNNGVLRYEDKKVFWKNEIILFSANYPFNVAGEVSCHRVLVFK